jgi:hypothetical protein
MLFSSGESAEAENKFSMTICLDQDFFRSLLFLQVFCDVNTNRTGAEENTAEKKRKFAFHRISHQASYKGFQSDIPCLAEISEVRLIA